MVRPAKWISSMAVGLALSWQGLPAQAQQFSFDGDTPPERLEQTDGGDQNPSDQPADDDTNTEMPEDGNAGNEYPDAIPSDAIPPDGDDAVSPDQLETEVIRERFPSGSIKVERNVTQDAQGNYVNHGAWKMWDQRGNLMAQGQYRHGQRSGTWIRWFRNPTEAALLTKTPYSQFTGPFISQATFDNGLLHGAWTIYDGKSRKISQWDFSEGRRNGPSLWWYAGGKKMREVHYKNGEIDGQLMEWSPEGQATVNDTYQGGRKLATKTARHAGGGTKKSEGVYLFAKETEQTPDDWWECKVQTTVKQGQDERHGAWTSWYGNGQRQIEGAYEHDMQVGGFTWWHQNGQKALEGHFNQGKQDGAWTWWYPTGQKSIHGEYANGNPTGRWTWWKEDGKVAQSADLSHSEGVVIDSPAVPSPATPPQPKTAKPRSPVRR